MVAIEALAATGQRHQSKVVVPGDLLDAENEDIAARGIKRMQTNLDRQFLVLTSCHGFHSYSCVIVASILNLVFVFLVVCVWCSFFLHEGATLLKLEGQKQVMAWHAWLRPGQKPSKRFTPSTSLEVACS